MSLIKNMAKEGLKDIKKIAYWGASPLWGNLSEKALHTIGIPEENQVVGKAVSMATNAALVYPYMLYTLSPNNALGGVLCFRFSSWDS